MRTNDIRQLFLSFFAARGHTVVPSSPILPANDPTLLFTNAGMVQFKDTFLGNEQRPYQRATTAQRCVRAGGKHNDLDNVGYTERHHTFFEMLGNFSFGDYFKHEAIHYCWDLLTKVMKIPRDSLWVTVHESDHQAERIWLDKIGIDRMRFSRCGDSSNFWSMGDVGPCGPCSEVFYDHGPMHAGGPPGSRDEDGDRYTEIWNLVFMQYNRDVTGTLHALPCPSVDTGMGLERIAAVLQGVHSNYHIDLFRDLINAAAELTQTNTLSGKPTDTLDKATETSLRVISDHIRACAFLIIEGVIPSNEGRGYVLRRIIRRAVQHGRRLAQQQPFFWCMVSPLVAAMGDSHPELNTQRQYIERILQQEEQLFSKTMDQGMPHLSQAIAAARDGKLSGSTVFKLYDTYGVPTDLTADIAREHALQVDWDGFEHSMQQQRHRARGARRTREVSSNAPAQSDAAFDVESLAKTHFCGYQKLTEAATIIALYNARGERVERLDACGQVVLDVTPFYAESGGQVGDHGSLQHGEAVLTVDDTQSRNAVIRHAGTLTGGYLCVGDQVTASVDVKRREASARNHTATHLLHAALCKILGPHVQQKGSLVEPARLRFDFFHHQALSSEDLLSIERCVNEWILANVEVITEVMPLEQAQHSGAMALFSEKYSDPVRVLKIGTMSTELCGGTHVNRSGDIGLFKITDESSIAAGVRRLQALSGYHALLWLSETSRQMNRIAALLQSDQGQLIERLEALVTRRHQQDKQLQLLHTQLSATKDDHLLQQAVNIKGVQVLSTRLDNATSQQLRDTLERLKNKLKSTLIVLASVVDGKVTLIAGVSKDNCDRLSAKDLIKFLAAQIDGRGGGRDDLAQAGSHDHRHLDQALNSVSTWVEERLNS